MPTGIGWRRRELVYADGDRLAPESNGSMEEREEIGCDKQGY